MRKNARILIVDDQEANIRLLQRLLQANGYDNIATTTDAREVPDLCATPEPDLILLDLHMPHVDGFQVMELLRPMIERHAYLPILVLTADVTPPTKQRALAGGAKDFVTKPFDPVEVPDPP